MRFSWRACSSDTHGADLSLVQRHTRFIGSKHSNHLDKEDVQRQHRVVGALPPRQKWVGRGICQRFGHQEADCGLQAQQSCAHPHQVDG